MSCTSRSYRTYGSYWIDIAPVWFGKSRLYIHFQKLLCHKRRKRLRKSIKSRTSWLWQLTTTAKTSNSSDPSQWVNDCIDWQSVIVVRRKFKKWRQTNFSVFADLFLIVLWRLGWRNFYNATSCTRDSQAELRLGLQSWHDVVVYLGISRPSAFKHSVP